VVTTVGTQPTSHSVDAGFEGYVFIESDDRPADTIAFNLYLNVATGDYVSAISAPLGYTLQAQIGYVLQ